MTKTRPITVNGQTVHCGFISRYRDQNDYLMQRHVQGVGFLEGRVSKMDDGRIWTNAEHYTQEDAVAILTAFLELEAADDAVWLASFQGERGEGDGR